MISGIRLIQSFSKATGPIAGRLMANRLFKSMAESAQHDLDNFKNHIEADAFAQGSAPESILPSDQLVAASALDSLSKRAKGSAPN